jgi:5-methylcytosine-specific restriction endonuclease McrA
MEKEYLERMIEEGNSLNKIVKITGKSLGTIQHWVKKYDLKSKFNNFKVGGKIEYGEDRFCPRCQKMVKLENFNNRRGKDFSSVYCKPCASSQTLERMRKLKQQMVDYKGGCCQKCGYNKYIGALEFHHINPEEKDFNPSSLKKYTMDTRITEELDKCILLCSNCHRETHHEINEKKKELI